MMLTVQLCALMEERKRGADLFTRISVEDPVAKVDDAFIDKFRDGGRRRRRRRHDIARGAAGRRSPRVPRAAVHVILDVDPGL